MSCLHEARRTFIYSAFIDVARRMSLDALAIDSGDSLKVRRKDVSHCESNIPVCSDHKASRLQHFQSAQNHPLSLLRLFAILASSREVNRVVNLRCRMNA